MKQCIENETISSSGTPFIQRAKLTFPNADIDVAPDSARTVLDEVRTTNYRVIQLRAPGVAVDLSSRKALDSGLERYVKVVWQIAGTARILNKSADFQLNSGDAAVLPLAHDYRFEAGDLHDALFVVFSTTSQPAWLDLAEEWPTKPIKAGSAMAAARAGVGSLISHADGSQNDTLAVEACLQLMLKSLADDGRYPQHSVSFHHQIKKAALLVRQNVSDYRYDPGALARDLGRSRRSLYKDFEDFGTSPAQFIRKTRLDHAKQEILKGSGSFRNLTQIALECGFADSASFSHAFKKAFGQAPSSLLKSSR